MGYCTNYDVWWKNSTEDRDPGDWVGEDGEITVEDSKYEEFRAAACFSGIWRSIPSIKQIRVYLCLEYPGENQYGETYADDANLAFSKSDIERYVQFLNKLGLRCKLEPEMFTIDIRGHDVEAYAVTVNCNKLSTFATLVALNALRYLYEYSDGHQEFAKAILAFDKDRTALCSKWNKFVLAHFVSTSYHSGHCARPHSSFMAMMGDLDVKPTLSKLNDSHLEQQMPKAPQTYTIRRGQRPEQEIVDLWKAGKPLREIIPVYRRMAYGG